MTRPAQRASQQEKGARTRARKAARKRKQQAERARQSTGCGPVTVTNTRTGETATWEPYTPKQVAAMDFGMVRRPRRKRA